MGWGTFLGGHRLYLLLLVFLTLSGCVHDGRLTYLEPSLPRKDVAVLQMQCSGLSPIWLDEVDGAKVNRPEKAEHYEVRVMPGDRYLVFTYGLIDAVSIRIYFVTTPNHTYTVEGTGAQVRITDVDTHASSTFP